MKDETRIQSEILLALSSAGLMPFRNTVGKGWVSPPPRTYRAKAGGERVKLNRGDVLLRSPSYITWGLAPGSSDIIAVTPVTIKEQHLGMVMGVFTGIEVKTPDSPGKRGGKEQPKQEAFRIAINKAGGIAGVAHSPEEAVSIVEDAFGLMLPCQQPLFDDK